ncbi:helix-turn-helix domain-containing protein [Propionimicrobium lymphophilum]|uniref:helix-turn-helix domain-containing protein n=1 Tax=Propionimicrobium lymphophilum TaxID=33012 RepID=UPI0023F2FB2A|nr:helix-turn-helix domain-containing protein [Propionimicrobium lymphophilum]
MRINKELDNVTNCLRPKTLLVENSRQFVSSGLATDVLILKARGMTRQQIADELGISPRQVSRLVQSSNKEAGQDHE